MADIQPLVMPEPWSVTHTTITTATSPLAHPAHPPCPRHQIPPCARASSRPSAASCAPSYSPWRRRWRLLHPLRPQRLRRPWPRRRLQQGEAVEGDEAAQRWRTALMMCGYFETGDCSGALWEGAMAGMRLGRACRTPRGSSEIPQPGPPDA
jgi:hypothetical protein